MKYPLAPNGIFRTVQGEGSLLGLPMVFVRLAGCSVGCGLCDTDYRVAQRAEEDHISQTCLRLATWTGPRWVWITGGEPTDHDLSPLIKALRASGLFVALATAGHKDLPESWKEDAPHFLSVSPHDPEQWRVFCGNELKLIPGLKGHHLLDFDLVLKERQAAFGEKFVVPCAGLPGTVEECRQWVETHEGWKMGVQAHKVWGIP